MRTAEEIFGLSNVGADLDKNLTKFYDAVEAALEKANPGIASELPHYSRLPMHLIPFRERTELIGQYRSAIGLDQALGSLASRPGDPTLNVGGMVAPRHRSNVSKIFDALRTDTPIDAEKPFGRLPTDDMGGSRLSRIFSSLNIQYNKRAIMDRAGITSLDSALPSSYFSVGLGSIPSRSQAFAPEITADMVRGGSRLVYDIETAGLAKGQIREVAYSVNNVPQETLLFNPKEFQRGLVNVDGRAGNLNDFLRRKHGLNIPRGTTTGDEFAEGMIPFLKAIDQTDYIVGQNISAFDNEQVFVGLSRTKKYRKDKAFRALVDKAHKKVQERTVDTLKLAREMPSLSQLSTAKELSAMDIHTTYSIQNLLLETDLSDRIEGFEDLVKNQGLHHASVDIEITNAILDAGPEGLQPKSMPQGAVRRSIVESSAITPFSNVASPELLDDDVLRHLIRTYSDDEKGLVARKGSELDTLLRSSSEADQLEAFSRIRSGSSDLGSIKLTYIEQQMLKERNLAGPPAAQDSTLLGRLKARQKIKAAKSPIEAQSIARSAGMPFAGLSSGEREVAFGLSEATSTLHEVLLANPNEARAAGVASDALVSRFAMFGPENVQYVSQSGQVTLPNELLKRSRILGENDLVSLSVVEPTTASKGGINVVKSLTDDQAEKLKSFLGRVAAGSDEEVGRALGYTDETAADVIEAGVAKFRAAMDVNDGDLLSRIGRRGVNVAQIYGDENAGAVQGVVDTFRRFLNVDGQLEDRAMGAIGLPVSDLDYDRGILRSAGAVSRRGLGADEVAGIAAETRLSKVLYGAVIQSEATNDPSLVAASAMHRLSNTMDSEVVQGVYSTIQKHIIPNLGKGLVGAVAVGAGALLFKRHQETEILDETLEFQGWEGSGQGQYGAFQQIQAQKAMGYDGYTNLVDPLATASLTNNLSLSRTNHHNYDWDRNNQIYGGVL